MRYKKYTEYVLLAFATALLLCAATYKLSEAPAVWFDEGLYSQAAMNLAEHGKQTIQTAPGSLISSAYLTVGYSVLFPVSLSYKLFSVGVVQGRAVIVLFTLAFAAAAYVLVRMLFGRWQAAWALLLLASFPVLYGNGKPVLGEVPGMFFLLLTCIALVKLERSEYRNIWAYLAAGLAAGLCVVTKPIFIMLLPALAVTWFIKRRTIQVRWAGFFLAVGAFLLPVLVWAYIQFGGDGTLAKQLQYYLASPYPTNDKIGRALANFKQFFTQTTPIYVAFTIVIWGVSMFLRKKKKIVISAVEMFLFLFCFFILGMYLRIEGWYRYFFPAQIVALLFLPRALTASFAYVSERAHWLRKLYCAPYAFILLLVLMQLYQLAQSSYVAQYYQSTNTADVRSALSALGKESSFFLANVPEVAILLPSRNYYQYIDVAPDLRLGADQMPVLEKGIPLYVLLLPDTYTANPEIFARYHEHSQVGKYLVLIKR